VLEQVEKLVGDDNLDSLSNTLDNLEAVTGAMAMRAEDIDSLIGNAAGTMENINRSTSELAALASQLRGDAQTIVASADRTLGAVERLTNNIDGVVETNAAELTRTLKSFGAAASSIQALSEEVDAMVAENREPLRDFTASGLYELAGLLNQMRTLVSRLNSVTTAVERDPARFLFGDSQSGYETQPTTR
jgi:phospholipid/cholesterol/gamma-HCH transport system substrate-binding protein